MVGLLTSVSRLAVLAVWAFQRLARVTSALQTRLIHLSGLVVRSGEGMGFEKWGIWSKLNVIPV